MKENISVITGATKAPEYSFSYLRIAIVAVLLSVFFDNSVA